VLVEVGEWSPAEKQLLVEGLAGAGEHEVHAAFLVQMLNAGRLKFRMEN
jgi:hypothetical protein